MENREYERMFRVEETHWWHRSLRALLFNELEQRLPGWRNKEILDAGCGTGIILRQLGDSGKNLGVDIAPQAIGFCRNRGLNNLLRGDIASLPLAGESFDAVICSSVLYHQWVKDVGGALQEIHRVLRNGGLLLLNVPARGSPSSHRDRAVFTGRRFAVIELQSLLRAHGFTPRRTTAWVTLLFPLAWLLRKIQTLGLCKNLHEDALPPAWVNGMLTRFMAIEAFLLRWFSFPFGVSIFCAACKTGKNPEIAGEIR